MWPLPQSTRGCCPEGQKQEWRARASKVHRQEPKARQNILTLDPPTHSRHNCNVSRVAKLSAANDGLCRSFGRRSRLSRVVANLLTVDVYSLRNRLM